MEWFGVQSGGIVGLLLQTEQQRNNTFFLFFLFKFHDSAVNGQNQLNVSVIRTVVRVKSSKSENVGILSEMLNHCTNQLGRYSLSYFKILPNIVKLFVIFTRCLSLLPQEYQHYISTRRNEIEDEEDETPRQGNRNRNQDANNNDTTTEDIVTTQEVTTQGQELHDGM